MPRMKKRSVIGLAISRRFRFESLARLEHGLGVSFARAVLDGLFTVAAPQRATGVQQTQQNDEPQTHSRLLQTSDNPSKQPRSQGRAMI